MTYAKFQGALTVEPPLNKYEVKALTAFFGSRRILTHGGPLDCRDLPGFHSQVIDIAKPAEGQPGLWCDLKISEDGKTLSWNDQSETTERNLDEWVIYVIDHLFKEDAEFNIRERNFDLSDLDDDNLLRSFTFDHYVDGEMTGEVMVGDTWKILVKDNVVTLVKPVFTIPLAATAEVDADDEDEDE